MENVSSRCGKSDNAPRLRFPEFSGEWVEKKIKEFANCYAGATPSTKERKYWENGTIPWLSSGEVNKKHISFTDNFITKIGYDSCSTKMIPANTVVMALAGQGKTRGTVAITEIELCTNQSLASIVTNETVDDKFLLYYLETQYSNLRAISSGDGTRGGLNLNIINEYSVFLASLPEQKKIAAFFTLLDRRIQKQRQLVEFLKTYKRGYFRYLLSTFTTKEYLLNDIIFEYTEKATSNRQYPILSSTMNGIKLQTTYFNKYAASENTIGYKIVPYGYFTYRSMSDTGEFHFNYQDIIDKGIVSPAYPVFCVSEFHNSRFVEYILNETDFIKSQLMIAKEGGTRYALSFPKFQRLRIQLPDKFIQDKVAEQIVLFERKISSEEKVLLSFEVQKKHLLQQMFI